MEDHQEEEFKTPVDQFTKELDALEQYNHTNSTRENIARMSLFKQFDPLVALAKSPIVQQADVDKNEFVDFVAPKEDENPNHSCTLIHINTPSSKQHYENISSQNEFTTNGHVNVKNEQLDIDDVQEETSEKLGQLFEELTLINENVFEIASNQIYTFQQQLNNFQKEEDKLNSIKSHLEEDLNNVEKNYYDTHSRYENLRSIVKEMDNRESQSKEKLIELASKLKDKEHECRKWKHVAEEAIENNNQRQQNVANKESVSLKAQIKVLEMRVNSLQSQIEQKNRENEELSHIVDELIGKKN